MYACIPSYRFKDPEIDVLVGECWQHAPSGKRECDYLSGWIKNQSHKQNSDQKMVNPRDIAWNAEE